MRVNIENCNNTGDPSAKDWVLGELVRNLKELRDRTDSGDMKALDEFFGLFVFNDDQGRKKVGAGETAKPVAWIRFCSDGGYEGPIADCDKRMDDTRRKSGAWTPLFATHNDQAQGAAQGLLRGSPGATGSAPNTTGERK